ncbi:MAG: E3 binding domain-containing protein, partial [Gallionellaceae bacterium]|nr:E3 binding domain-containing protein [Gallionellaceae bacterium]
MSNAEILEIRSPQLSESVTEATLLTWHKQAGDVVAEGENLVDVETDKVVLELPAPAAGVLKEILKGEGEKVGSGEVVAVLEVGAAMTKQKAKTSVASPSVRKLAHERDVDVGGVKGSGEGGRVTRGDVMGVTPSPRPSPTRGEGAVSGERWV